MTTTYFSNPFKRPVHLISGWMGLLFTVFFLFANFSALAEDTLTPIPDQTVSKPVKPISIPLIVPTHSTVQIFSLSKPSEANENKTKSDITRQSEPASPPPLPKAESKIEDTGIKSAPVHHSTETNKPEATTNNTQPVITPPAAPPASETTSKPVTPSPEPQPTKSGKVLSEKNYYLPPDRLPKDDDLPPLPSARPAPPRIASVQINIPSRTLILSEDNKIIKTWPVGVGRPGFMTPVGRYKIIRMVMNPGWENPYKAAGEQRINAGNSNPLGTRWMGFHQTSQGEYGIHGTDNPASVGKFSSHGCVRMKIPDAEDLFNHIDVGTPVVVTYEILQVRAVPADEQAHTENLVITVNADTFKKGFPTLQQAKAKITALYPDVEINDRALATTLALHSGNPVTVGKIVSVKTSDQPSIDNTAKSSQPALPETEKHAAQ